MDIKELIREEVRNQTSIKKRRQKVVFNESQEDSDLNLKAYALSQSQNKHLRKNNVQQFIQSPEPTLKVPQGSQDDNIYQSTNISSFKTILDQSKQQVDMKIESIERDIEKILGLFPILQDNQKSSQDQLSVEVGSLRTMINSISTRVLEEIESLHKLHNTKLQNYQQLADHRDQQVNQIQEQVALSLRDDLDNFKEIMMGSIDAAMKSEQLSKQYSEVKNIKIMIDNLSNQSENIEQQLKIKESDVQKFLESIQERNISYDQILNSLQLQNENLQNQIKKLSTSLEEVKLPKQDQQVKSQQQSISMNTIPLSPPRLENKMSSLIETDLSNHNRDHMKNMLPFEERKSRFKDIKSEIDQYLYGVRLRKRLRDYTLDERVKRIRLLNYQEIDKLEGAIQEFEFGTMRYYSQQRSQAQSLNDSLERDIQSQFELSHVNKRKESNQVLQTGNDLELSPSPVALKVPENAHKDNPLTMSQLKQGGNKKDNQYSRSFINGISELEPKQIHHLRQQEAHNSPLKANYYYMRTSLGQNSSAAQKSTMKQSSYNKNESTYYDDSPFTKAYPISQNISDQTYINNKSSNVQNPNEIINNQRPSRFTLGNSQLSYFNPGTSIDQINIQDQQKFYDPKTPNFNHK
eukprot:403367110